MSASLASTSIRPVADYSPWLESLRGAACLAVVFFHAELPPDVTLHPALAAFSPLARLGWLGVTVFFVLSGFLIGRVIERRASSPGSALTFWRDRLLRIYPAFWAAWLVSIALALAATPFNGLPAASGLPASASALLSDLTLTTVWFDQPSRLLVSWSLVYEVGFYLLAGLPLLARAASPLFRLGFFATLTAVAHSMPPGLAPVLDLWPRFACGLAVAYALLPSLPRSARVAALAYPAGQLVLLLCGEAPFSAIAPLSALLILGLLRFESRLPRPPSALITLGAASYSIYLIHIPIMSPLRNFALRFVSPTSHAYLLVWLGVVVAGLAAGLIFYHLVEHRLERVRHRLFRRLAPPHAN